MPLLWIGSWTLAELGKRLGGSGCLRRLLRRHSTLVFEEHMAIVAVVVSKDNNNVGIMVNKVC